MAKVAIFVLGSDLAPCHAVRAVNVLDDVRSLEGPRETRPSRPAVERREERLAANRVDVEARLLIVPVSVCAEVLGPVGLGDAILLGIELETASGFFP
jgi:hypothetical protein